MKLGVCGSPAVAGVLAEAGFDYIEVNVVRDLQPELPDADVAEQLARLRNLPLPAPVANVFLPGTLRLTGEGVDLAAAERYVRTAFARAAAAGIEIIVFGSGAARRIPDGFDRARAWAQLVDFGSVIGPLAVDHGVTIAVEPLNYAECNVLNTVAESAQYVRDVAESAQFVRDVNHAGVRLLVDAYHWARNGEPTTSIVAAGSVLVHAHIATYANRLAPGQEPCDFAPFFAALCDAEYGGALSVEARGDIDAAWAKSTRAALQGLLVESGLDCW